ncbi:MAG: aminofutalosine synthase MqnE, partial [Bacteroidales bacterium]|nr:aminofutalosine synthase MqnE [Bacteroidales bacterium]
MKSPEDYTDDPVLKKIIRKVRSGKRIREEEGIALYEKAGLSLLSLLSEMVRRRHNGDKAFFNRNFHIEPTNLCVHNCRFCSYHKSEGDPESWEYSH